MNNENEREEGLTIERWQAPHAGRADRLVIEHLGEIGRRRVARLFEAGRVRVAGRRADKGSQVEPGAEIELTRTEADEDTRVARPDPTMQLVVLYEDEALVIVDKPAGVPSHPLRAGELGCLANALVARYPECAEVGSDPREAGLVHRLDIDTSGVIAAARTQNAWERLRDSFSNGIVRKRYWALTIGVPSGTGSEAALVHRGRRMGIAPPDAPKALAAQTSWTVQERIGPFALVACQAHTGRMHQVRVHLAHAGAPLVGDALYGDEIDPEFDDALRSLLREDPEAHRHFLHASTITLPHPLSRLPVHAEAPMPPAREHLLAELSLWLTTRR